MALPGEQDLITERAALVATLDSLTDEEFESGRTLCEGWAPRDILAHVMGVDRQFHQYVLALGNINKANGRMVEQARSQRRDRLMHRARHWVTHPAPHARAAAVFLIGDVATHHQDIIRGLGKERSDIPEASRRAILREGVVLGGKRLLSHKVEPTDGGPSIGRGTRVRGTSEALGMWLAGREGIEPELQFLDN